MAKPSKLPRWADTVEADPTRVVEPSAGKKDVGFEVSERAAAQHFNWLWLIIYKWLAWLDTQFADDGVKRVQGAEGGFPASPGDGDVCLTGSTEVGLFIYRLSATDAPDGVMVYDGPGGVGRWLHSSYSARGIGDGVASLDGFGKVPGPQLGRGNNNGVASLNASGKVEQDPASKGMANGVASLNASGKVVQDPASKGMANGVASLGPDKELAVVSSDSTAYSIYGQSTGVGTGVQGESDSGPGVGGQSDSGPGVEGGSISGPGGKFHANAVRGAINIAYPGEPDGAVGDLVFDTTSGVNKLKVCTAPGTWKIVTMA